jgi:hypothetical protein
VFIGLHRPCNVFPLQYSRTCFPLNTKAPAPVGLQDMPTGKDTESISDTEEWSALQEHVKDINATCVQPCCSREGSSSVRSCVTYYKRVECMWIFGLKTWIRASRSIQLFAPSTESISELGITLLKLWQPKPVTSSTQILLMGQCHSLPWTSLGRRGSGLMTIALCLSVKTSALCLSRVIKPRHWFRAYFLSPSTKEARVHDRPALLP